MKETQISQAAPAEDEDGLAGGASSRRDTVQIIAAVTAGLAVAVISAHLLGLSRPWFATGAITAALLGAGITWFRDGPSAVTGWWMMTFVSAGAWLTWARFADLMAAAPWAGLIIGVLVLASAYQLAQRMLARALELEAELAGEQARLEEEARWPRLLTQIGHDGITVHGREITASGHVVGLRLPASGRVKLSTLITDSERLEIAADIRRGSIRFESGRTARDVMLYVADKDVLADTIPFIDDGEPLSIHNPIPVGRYDSGEICELTLREICVLIAGLRGSGKSNLLNVLIAQLSRCVDALVFVSDTKSRMVMPWVLPYLNGRVRAPAITWAATTRPESEAMIRGLRGAIDARSASVSGGEKLDPTPAEPAVLAVIDEVPSLIGDNRQRPAQGASNMALGGILTEVVQLGRSEAVDVILAGQRASVTMMGGSDLKSQCGIAIGLRVRTASDARMVIGDDIQAQNQLLALKYEGTGIVEDLTEGRSAPVKFFRIGNEQIALIAERYADIRPEADAVLASGLGEAYEGRWDRFREARNVPVPPPALTVTLGTSEIREDAAQRRPVPEGPATDRAFEQIVKTGLADMAEPTGASAEKAKQRMMTFIQRSTARKSLVTVSMIKSAAGVSPAIARKWLDEGVAAGVLECPRPNRWRARK